VRGHIFSTGDRNLSKRIQFVRKYSRREVSKTDPKQMESFQPQWTSLKTKCTVGTRI
jgi:hypothetical protein